MEHVVSTELEQAPPLQTAVRVAESAAIEAKAGLDAAAVAQSADELVAT